MKQLTATQYRVEGMTCEHCTLSVREEVAEVEGVSEVDVDRGSGRLEVRGVGYSGERIRDAVADAGYRVAA